MSFRHESISAGLPERVLRALFLLFFLMAGAASADERLTLNFDPGWKFIKADPTNAFQAGFNDGGWSSVSLPHTYNDVDTLTVSAGPPPTLGITASGTNAIISWLSGTDPGFVLQSTTNLASPIWSSAGTPATIGNQNIVTNALNWNAQFYRLKK